MSEELDDQVPVKKSTIIVDDDDETSESNIKKIINEQLLSSAEREKRRLEKKPIIDHLKDAVVTTAEGLIVLIPDVGEKIIIERRASCLKISPWLDTRIYEITKIDDESGLICLWDQELHHHAFSNFIDGPKLGYRFKIPSAKGSIFMNKKRGRPRKNPEKEVTDVPVDATKKRRGRPPGSKNRDAQ
jgi:hypothetical protein